jgi:ribosomal protein S6E (S10)
MRSRTGAPLDCTVRGLERYHLVTVNEIGYLPLERQAGQRRRTLLMWETCEWQTRYARASKG